MSVSTIPWTGTWIDIEEPLVTHADLVLTIAAQRGCTSNTISEELDGIDEHFDVDAVYIERD